MADARRSPARAGGGTGHTDAPCPPALPPLVIHLRRQAAAGPRRYVAGSAGHPDRMPPGLAAALLHEYTQPGNLVLDPLAGTGTTLAEAARAGRNAIGVEYETGWVALARANLALARQQGAGGHARILCRDATRLPSGIPHCLRGTTSLVLTAPPAARTMPGHPSGCGTTPSGRTTSRGRGGRAGRVAVFSGLTSVLAGCRALLAPAGQVIVVARARPSGGAHAGSLGQVLQAGLSAGLHLTAVRHAVQASHLGETCGYSQSCRCPATGVVRYAVAVFSQAC
ncbi:DNA methyltransferase [Actinoplanes sp. Pm04-4]|uniref:Methyltransferase n=1 Tax=Paractinoplanes pyxinae TaxID=2997416 RepID=A0ABT4BBY6_9ACTN|nr:DNA methyltransferase [Actinoplanes pyxinae]MCY1144033.1 DNA methyltransferase [Actinoplanes pyxinae]